MSSKAYSQSLCSQLSLEGIYTTPNAQTVEAGMVIWEDYKDAARLCRAWRPESQGPTGTKLDKGIKEV